MTKLSSPYVFIGILILTVIVSGAMCALNMPTLDHASATDVSNGSTVISGDKIVDNQNIQKEPLSANPLNILRLIKNGEITTTYLSLITGAAPKDIIKNDTYITQEGKISDELTGPGKVIMDSEGKISIEEPTSMIWGYKLPYTVAVKNGDSINLVQNNTTIKTININDINNDSISTEFVTAKSVQNWAKLDSTKNGTNMTIDYYLGKFNDNRSSVYGKDNIIHEFGNYSYNYMRNYTPGAPVLVYEHDASRINVSSGYAVVQDLAGYPTAIRAANAREFATGWNGTIIPPHSSAHGKENVTFTAIPETEAESGMATHGVCPPGRALRQAVLAMGSPMPVGMTSGDEAILYGFRPTIDISVSNTLDYPIEILMWTEGQGGGTTIYAKIIELKDNATYINNSTNTTNSTSE